MQCLGWQLSGERYRWVSVGVGGFGVKVSVDGARV